MVAALVYIAASGTRQDRPYARPASHAAMFSTCGSVSLRLPGLFSPPAPPARSRRPELPCGTLNMIPFSASETLPVRVLPIN
jgi:hypothetical protein